MDTTVNIDTTSIFWLTGDISDSLTQQTFDHLRSKIEAESSYEWNFHKGNHFIALARRCSDGRPALVIHSNEKEFKYQFNGLMPVEGNWYMPSLKIYRNGPLYLRLLEGQKAELFKSIAANLQAYNIDRHRLLALLLVGDHCGITDDYHKHHYFMPSADSVAIGCYLCEAGEVVPVLSRVGGDIHFFEAHGGGGNRVQMLDGRRFLLVPHGWGKTSKEPAVVHYDDRRFEINGLGFDVKPKVSLGTHPGLVIREFSQDPSSDDSIFLKMAHHTPGRVIDTLTQVCSYTKLGFMRHVGPHAT